ncbi:hypothetical protein GQR58_020373 [Nymphon striatum]|nr:hypothetical protein GQR58_020373 [Nymphon striatum]
MIMCSLPGEGAFHFIRFSYVMEAMVLSSISNIALAENLKDSSDTKVLAEKMVSHFIKKEFTEGMAVAKPHWPLPQVELDNLIKTIEKQWPIIDRRFGKAVSSELVLEQNIGDSFLRYYYFT